MAVARLRPFAKNARTHSEEQVRQIAESIEKLGFTNPIVISDDEEIIVEWVLTRLARPGC